MSTVPRLSIGLPVYNGEKFLAESLDALLGQSYEDFELIISDNASTDGTADICRRYGNQDPRIRYVRQPRNIGCAANHNFVIEQARGELFKTASHDDLYARDLLRLCVDALDEHPHVVLAHSWSAVIDSSGAVTELVDYPVNTAAAQAPERFRSMLFDGWGDDEGGVIRMSVLRRTSLHASYHFADRTFTAEIALHGPFYMVPDWLYFRRQHAGQGGARTTVRARCANLDPRRADRLRHPAARLYAEYIWGYVAAIRRAPLSPADRQACYRLLSRWVASRAVPVAGRSLSRSGLRTAEPTSAAAPDIAVSAVVAGLATEAFVTVHGRGASRARSTAPRVGIFGKVGAGNIGNDASMEAVLGFLNAHQPDAVVDAMCTGPDLVSARYGIEAVPLFWHHKFDQQGSGVTATALKVLGKGVDAVRTATWVRRHDVVIVPGAGVLEASLPMVPRGFPYALFLLCASGKVFGAKVAMVSVGAGVINQPLTRWLFNSAARLAFYRSYRDPGAREAMRNRGIDVSRDHVYPDLAFALPAPPGDTPDEQTVAVGVMAYYGTNDERKQAEEIYSSYVAGMQSFVRWLVDNGRKVLLLVGDVNGSDDSVVQEILADLRVSRPDLDPSVVVAADVSSYADVMRVLQPASSVVAIRYHNILCALKLSKPTISIGYSPKHDVLMAEMGLPEFCQDVSTLDISELIKLFTELESRSAELRQVLTERNAAKARLLDDLFAELSVRLFPPAEPAQAPTVHEPAR